MLVLNTKRMVLVPVVALAVVGMTACDNAQSTSDRQTSEIVGQQQQIYDQGLPLPVYDYSAVRDTLIQINNAIVPDMRPAWFVFSTPGIGITDSCAGVGAPIPYSTQLTNPQRPYKPDYQDTTALPQPEPDGTYKPDATQGTWVLCDFGNGIEPVYVEDQVRAYFHPVKVENGKVVHLTGKPSVTIDIKGAQK